MRAARVIVVLCLLASAGLSLAQSDLQKALAELKAGHAEQAISGLKALAAQSPGNLGVQFWLGRALLQAGQVDEAIERIGCVFGLTSLSPATLVEPDLEAITRAADAELAQALASPRSHLGSPK